MEKLNLNTLLIEEKAAEILVVTTETLRKWRVKGIGPVYVKIGRLVRYQLSDLMAFIEQNKVAVNG